MNWKHNPANNAAECSDHPGQSLHQEGGCHLCNDGRDAIEGILYLREDCGLDRDRTIELLMDVVQANALTVSTLMAEVLAPLRESIRRFMAEIDRINSQHECSNCWQDNRSETASAAEELAEELKNLGYPEAWG
jgi:hypothetical protein